jgi:hypothetical protein
LFVGIPRPARSPPGPGFATLYSSTGPVFTSHVWTHPPPTTRQPLPPSSAPRVLLILLIPLTTKAITTGYPTPSRQSHPVAPSHCPRSSIANVAARTASIPPILHSDIRTATTQTLRRRRGCPPHKPRLPLQCHIQTKFGPHRSSLRPHAMPHNMRHMLPSTSAQTRTSRSGQARALAWALAYSQRARPASTPSTGTAKYGQSALPPAPRMLVLTTFMCVSLVPPPPLPLRLLAALSEKTASDPCVTRCGHLFCWSHLREVCFSRAMLPGCSCSLPAFL